ncbi:MAG: BglG family transcription antiterminator [Selenomonadaceae bacterium]|nr:BglG family transcription antiterminator [Selenomonadaceae bacterium]
MEQRTRDILKLLLHEKNYQTTAQIAEQLNVSAKTVSRQLSKVEEVLLKAGLQLEKKSGAGILIVGNEVKRYGLAAQLKSGDKKEYTPTERRSIIISKLLSSREPIKLFVLSSAVHVTDSTISNDLDKLEQWFREHGLKLLRKPGLGVSLLGDERDLRRAIVRYIYEHVGEESLLNLMQDNLPEDDDATVAQVSKFLLELIDAGEWRRLEQMIRVTENELGYKLSDNAFIGLTVHLSLALRRIKNHESITVDEEICSRIKDGREFAAAKKIAEKISAAFGVNVPDSEICYITMHILGARSRYNSASIGKISMMDNFHLVTLAKQIMKRAAKITGRDIDKNQSLLAGLVNHLAPTISRLKMHMDIRNPLLNEIREHYPELMSLTRKCVVEVEDEVGETLPDAEIAYIAMHLGAALSDSEKFLHAVHRVVVACPTGMGTSRLLASRLRANFPTIKIVDEIPILELTPEYIAAKDFEFIISTVPIPRAKCRVLVVSAALIDEDRKKIDAELSRQNKKFLGSAEEIEPRPPFIDALTKMTAYGRAILQLMTNYFFVRKNISDINEACELVGNLVGDDVLNREEISNDLLLREDKGSTLIFGRHMILLHCKSAAVKSAAFGILQLGNGFEYPAGGEVVRTAIVLLAPLDADEYALETIGHIASVLLDRWGFIEILHEGDGEEIRREVLKIFEDFYRTKQKELL